MIFWKNIVICILICRKKNEVELGEKFEVEIEKEEKTFNSSKKELPNGLSNRAKVLFEKLTEKPMHVDELSELSKLSTAEVLQAITELELYDVIRSYAGKRYSR